MRPTVLIAWLVAIASLGATVSGHAQPAPERVLINTSYDPPPASLEQLYDVSTVVLRGRIEESHVRPAIAGSTAPTVVTDHRVAVLELLKDQDKKLGQQKNIHVLQHAGTLQVGPKLFVADPGQMPVFVRGQELLLFLQDWPATGGLSITSGPAGAYVLDGEAVSLPAAVKHFASSFGGRRRDIPKAQFLAVIRATAARK